MKNAMTELKDPGKVDMHLTASAFGLGETGAVKSSGLSMMKMGIAFIKKRLMVMKFGENMMKTEIAFI